MEMKAKTNRRTSKIVIVIALVLVLITLLGTMSYAWIRNYVSVDKLEMKTGRMMYRIYMVKNGEAELLYDAANGYKQESIKVPIDNSSLHLEAEPGKDVFFVIQKYGDSIDLDAAISFESIGAASQYEFMGQTSYKIDDVTDEVTGLTAESNEGAIKGAIKNSFDFSNGKK